MQRLVVLLIAVALGSGTMVTGACLIAPPPECVSFTIVWNYDTSGFLETCGCSANQLGGIERRATLIARLRDKQPLIAIEGAHIVEDKGEFQLYKGETLIAMLNMMDYDALMLGVREAQQGLEGIARLRAAADFPCFSANLILDGPASKPLPSTVLVQLPGAVVGITGVSQPEAVSFELPEGIAFSDPTAALDRVLPNLSKDADLIILCLEGEHTWLSNIISRYQDSVDLFLSGDRHKATANYKFGTEPPWLNNWELGKRLGVVNVDPAPDGFHLSALTLDITEDIESSPEITGYMDGTYRPQLKERFFGKMKQDLEQIYLPPDTCGSCHTEELNVFQLSRHSQALKTLDDVGQLYNPECMLCHVVYDPDRDELQALNCVACHSNITEDHIWDAVKDEVVRPEVPVTAYTFEWCAQCHTEEQSLPFKEHWPQYVKHIYHGGDISAAEEAAERMGLDIDGEIPE
jgi:hypothetical protein